MGYLPDQMPLPDTIEIDTNEWWAACKRHELVIQQCASCNTFRHPPSPVCSKCYSFDFKWTRVEGNGTVYSYIICHHPVHPSLQGHPPYNVVLVELTDPGNVRMVGNVLDVSIDEIYVGMPVQVTWEDKTEDVTLPQWKRA